MSKTMDELMAAFKTGFRDRLQGPGIRPEGDIAIRAGIAAVVRAVRDEIVEDNNCKYCVATTAMYNKILGDAGDEVAEPTVGQRLIKAAHEAAAIARGEATAPAPAVCVWTDVGDAYRSACGRSHFAWTSRDGVVVCPHCKALIKFTEAKT